VQLRATVAAMPPRIDLPELILEVHAWTGFLDEYSHVGELAPRLEDLPVSVAALLVAEACNVGLTPVTNASVPALTRGRLSHVDQNYLRAETHSAANARLIGAQAGIGVAPAVGRWAGRLGRRAAVRGAGADHQRRTQPPVLRAAPRGDLAERGQRP